MRQQRRGKRKIVGTKVSMDYSLLFIIIFLLCFGLVMLYSTSSYNALIKYGKATYYLEKQILATGIGFVGMMLIAKMDYHRFVPLAAVAYIGSVICLILVKSPIGIEANGATRWIGIGPLSFQPAEAAKLGLIMLMAVVITNNRKRVGELKVTLGIGALAVPLVGLILILTKNMSSALIVAGIAVVMLFVASPKYSHYVCIAAAGAAAVVLVLLFGSGFRFERIQAWLNPEMYADGTAYQTLQSLYAIGSGGLVGKGLGQSVQKLGYVPEAQNDMIFSIICEELGLFGGVAVILLFAFMIWRFMIIANNAKDLFGSMLVVGVLAHIAIQVILNVAVVTNTFPNTGITLPFISYGGTSIVFLMAEMGLVLSVSKYERTEISDRVRK
ncbi:MAG: FtsW/RodA/SpoVE family cell cycle protein [Lachnospiraceae bacterium]